MESNDKKQINCLMETSIKVMHNQIKERKKNSVVVDSRESVRFRFSFQFVYGNHLFWFQVTLSLRDRWDIKTALLQCTRKQGLLTKQDVNVIYWK